MGRQRTFLGLATGGGEVAGGLGVLVIAVAAAAGGGGFEATGHGRCIARAQEVPRQRWRVCLWRGWGWWVVASAGVSGLVGVVVCLCLSVCF